MRPLISATTKCGLIAFRPHHLRTLTMASAPHSDLNGNKAQSASSVPKGKTEVKILMIHGFTQSGTLFSSKTKALSKLLTKTLSPAPFNLHLTLIYPTAPHRLRPSNIPGYASDDDDDDYDDNWGWFTKDEVTGAYRGFEEGMMTIAAAIAAAGGVDGVCGFSQGGAVAGLVTSALETPHRTPPSPSTTPAPSDLEAKTPADWTWVTSLREANNNQPLKFSVIYSGYYAPLSSLQWMYEPPIATPTLHFLGSLDTVVEEERSRGLVERCRNPTVVTHPGGHYVPVARDWAMALVGWLRQRSLSRAIVV